MEGIHREFSLMIEFPDYTQDDISSLNVRPFNAKMILTIIYLPFHEHRVTVTRRVDYYVGNYPA